MITREQVIDALKTVEDPELYLDIWLLGLVYKIEINGTEVTVDMTLTSPMCPAGPMLTEQVKSRVAGLGASKVTVNVVFDPPWQPSDEVKALLGLI